MIRIYSPSYGYHDIRMFFDLNGTACQIVKDANSEYDIIDGWRNLPGKKVSFDIWHNTDDQTLRYKQWLEDNDVYVVTNAVDNVFTHPRIVVNDFLFNRTKAYYTGFKFNPETIKWYFASEQCYSIPEHVTELKTKIFVSPLGYRDSFRLKFQACVYRLKFQKFITNFLNFGHVNQPMLFSNLDLPKSASIVDLENCKPAKMYQRQGYTPPHDAYYKNTFISMYFESIEIGTSIAVTEKTYDPLIKGHFILPFSSAGFVKHLQTLGFLMPPFVDYSYDSIVNDADRFETYCAEVERLVHTSITQWQQWWVDFASLRKHNQQLFFTKDYDRVDFETFLKT